jgi:hypothetical protein
LVVREPGLGRLFFVCHVRLFDDLKIGRSVEYWKR